MLILLRSSGGGGALRGLLTEGGDTLVTEYGDRILASGQPPIVPLYLLTEDGDNLLTEGGDYLQATGYAVSYP